MLVMIPAERPSACTLDAVKQSSRTALQAGPAAAPCDACTSACTRADQRLTAPTTFLLPPLPAVYLSPPAAPCRHVLGAPDL